MKKILTGVLTVIAMFACKKEQEAIYPELQVVFKIVEVDPVSADQSISSFECPGDKEGYSFESAKAEIVINGKIYYPGVYRENGNLYTNVIKLKGHQDQPTTYTVSKFLLETSDGDIIKVNPEKNAEYAKYVEEAVPIEFNINGLSKIETTVEVLCYLPENFKKYGFKHKSGYEIVLRQKCFFGDVCINPADYIGSDYENQSTGLQIDVPAIVQMVVKKDGEEVEGSPFTNATDDMEWGVGQPLCVTYPDYLDIEGEEFTFELYILVADGSGGFYYQLYHMFTATDDGPLDVIDYWNDGIVDFVLGDCVYNDPDDPSTDLELDWILPEETCETAFAYNEEYATCFIDLEEIHTKRWGWTNGPLSESEESYEFLIYAGAAKCDISKGTLVGSLSLDYFDGDATVTYTMDDGYLLDEVHIYVGNKILPKNKHGRFTVAPGQYPHVNEDIEGAQTYSYTFSDMSGDVYVIAHAVVCGVYPVK